MSDLQQEQTDFAVDAGREASIGDVLRQVRESRGESLSDVAHALKLSARQIEALELERFDLLPGPAFVRGFLRNYARYVGVDLEARIAQLNFGDNSQGVRLAPVTNATGDMPTGEGARNVLKPAMIVIVGMVVVLAAGWYFDWFKVDQTEPVSTVTSRGVTPSMGGGASSGFEASPPESMTMLPSAPASAQGVAEPGPGDEAAGDQVASVPDASGSGSDASQGAAVGPDVVQGADTVAAAAVADAPNDTTVAAESPTAEAAPEASDELGRLVFSLSGESWIQVRDGEGAALYTGTGSAGTTRTVQGKPPFSIVVGNAGLVSLEYDGEPVDLSPHIRSGGVARMTVQ